MALQTLYVNAGTNSTEWKCRLVVTEDSIDTSNNTSNLTLTLQFTRSRSGGYQAWCGYETSATLAVGGTSQTVSVASFNYSSVGVDDWKTLASATFNGVYHMNDGTMNAAVAGYWHQTYCQPNTCNPSGTVTLTTIPRASSVSIGTTEAKSIGDTVSINITKASSSFTHTVEYKVGTMSDVANIVTKTSDSTINWEVPDSVYAYMTNVSSATCYIYCDTYNGSTKLGTTTCTFTLYTNNSKPSISNVAVVDVDTAINAITGDNSIIIKGYSDAKITVTASASNEASIKTYSFQYGSTVTNTTSNNITINNVTASSVKVVVTDSRGKTVTYTKSLGLIDYSKPTITNFKVERESSLSSNVTLSANIKWFNGNIGSNANSLAIKYRYKSSGSYGSYTTITGTTTGNSCAVSSNISNISNTSNYTFELVATDLLGDSSKDTNTATCGVGTPIIDIGKNDIVINGELKPTTMKAGTYSSSSTSANFDTNIDLNQNNLVDTNIVYAKNIKKSGEELAEVTHDTNYIYIKYYDGSAIYYAHHKCEDCTNGAPSSDSGTGTGGIEGLQYVTCDYAFPSSVAFQTVNSASVTADGSGVGYWCSIGDMFNLFDNGTKTKYNARIYFISTLSWANDISQRGLSFVISGTWK